MTSILMILRVTSEPVTIVVGKLKEKFFVHESHLRTGSDFFNNIMNGPWQENATRTITLLDPDCRAFMAYVKWLYSGRFYIMESTDEVYDKDTDWLSDAEYSKL